MRPAPHTAGRQPAVHGGIAPLQAGVISDQREFQSFQDSFWTVNKNQLKIDWLVLLAVRVSSNIVSFSFIIIIIQQWVNLQYNQLESIICFQIWSWKKMRLVIDATYGSCSITVVVWCRLNCINHLKGGHYRWKCKLKSVSTSFC